MAASRTLVASLAVIVAVLSLSRAGGQDQAAVTVRLQINDAQVKDRALDDVRVRVLAVDGPREIAAATTGSDGRCSVRVPAGAYRLSYARDGYVPYTSGATELTEDGQLVTVSLSRLLEATGATGRVVRIILNWGSRRDHVKDVDSHLSCPCGGVDARVHYRQKVHEGAGHRVELDVDDMDWGGPETITLTDPPPGSYVYWVHNYSGPPATLGASEVVVRVVIGDHEAGEFPVFKGVTHRAWRPFRAIEVGADGRPVVVSFTQDEIAEGADLEVFADDPSSSSPPTPSATGTTGGPDNLFPWGCIGCSVLAFGAVVLVVTLVVLVRTRVRPTGK